MSIKVQYNVCIFVLIYSGGAVQTHDWEVPLNIQVKILLTSATVKCTFVYQQLPSMVALPGGPNTCSLHSGAETPGFWSKLIPSWRMTVMNGLGERDGWATHSPAQPSAPSNKDAGACPTFVGRKMWLCTVAQGTLHVGLPC